MFSIFRKKRLFMVLAIIVLIGIAITLAFSGLAASNVVPTTRMGFSTATTNGNTLKPAECSAITISNVIYCTAGVDCNGTNSSDLIFGTSSADTIDGKNRADCIIGGGGNDTINGGSGSGNDVCLGGPGSNTYTNCYYSNP